MKITEYTPLWRRSVNRSRNFGIRHIQVFMMFLCFTIAYALRVNLSIAIVAMTNTNSTEGNVETFTWNQEIKGTILSSFFWTYLALQIPSGYAAERYGAKHILALGMAVCSLATILVPVAAKLFNYQGVIAMRLLLGLGQGCLLPAMNALLSKWVPPSERNRAFTIALTGTNAGTLLTLPSAGLLAASQFGWPSIFYVFGGVTAIWVIVWLLIGASTPADYKLINPQERSYIESALSETNPKSKHKKVPWKEIVKSGPMYAILAAHLGQNWGFWIMLTQTPNYISSVLKFNIASNGFLSALPHLLGWMTAFLFSYAADYFQTRRLLTKTQSRKFWNSLAQWGGGVCLLLLALLQHPSSTVAIGLLTLSMALNSGVLNGFLTNHVELSPNFCGTLMGITNAIANFSSIAGPIFVGIIIGNENSDPAAWKVVFIVTFVSTFLINGLYVLLASGDIQPWNDIAEHESKDEEQSGNINKTTNKKQ